jgi:hypothetical protein
MRTVAGGASWGAVLARVAGAVVVVLDLAGHGELHEIPCDVRRTGDLNRSEDYEHLEETDEQR